MSYKLLVNGHQGRLGRVIVSTAKGLGWTVQGLGRGDTLNLSQDYDVAVDVSLAEATIPFAKSCANSKIPLIIGTTGHTEDQISHLHSVSTEIPLVMAPNFSIGVAIMEELLAKASHWLGPDYMVDILDIHRAGKKDPPPSGTTKRFLNRIETDANTHSIRSGNGYGEHTVYFSGQGERIEITNKVHSRDVYAHGALKAAEWVISKEPGIYNMNDVLNLSQPKILQ